MELSKPEEAHNLDSCDSIPVSNAGILLSWVRSSFSALKLRHSVVEMGAEMRKTARINQTQRKKYWIERFFFFYKQKGSTFFFFFFYFVVNFVVKWNGLEFTCLKIFIKQKQKKFLNKQKSQFWKCSFIWTLSLHPSLSSCECPNSTGNAFLCTGMPVTFSSWCWSAAPPGFHQDHSMGSPCWKGWDSKGFFRDHLGCCCRAVGGQESLLTG